MNSKQLAQAYVTLFNVYITEPPLPPAIYLVQSRSFLVYVKAMIVLDGMPLYIDGWQW